LSGSNQPLTRCAYDLQAERLEERNGCRGLAGHLPYIGDTVQTFSNLEDQIDVVAGALRRDRTRKRRI
jgi:hypothetical protein